MFKITQGLHDLVGDGLLTTDGDFHRWHRRLVQPSFSKRRVENYAEMIVQYTQETVEQWQPGAEIDIAHDMQALILRMIMKILVNIDVVQQDSEVGQILDAVLAQPSGTSPPYHAASKTWSTYEIGACSRHT
jgi:cytochrome P450